MDTNKSENILKVVSERIIRGNSDKEIGEILHKCNISYCVTKIYKKEILDVNNIICKEDLSMGKDAVFAI